MQNVDLARRERTRTDPAQQRPIVLQPDSVLVHGPRCDGCEPAPAGIAGQACSGRCRRCPGRKPQSLDDFSVISAPQPRASCNERVRNSERQRAAGKRQAVGEQMGAEFRQEPIGARAIGGGIDEPGKRRRKLHRAIMGRRVILVTGPSGMIDAASRCRRAWRFAVQDIITSALYGSTIDTEISAAGGNGESVQIMRPTRVMGGALRRVGKAAMGHAQ